MGVSINRILSALMAILLIGASANADGNAQGSPQNRFVIDTVERPSLLDVREVKTLPGERVFVAVRMSQDDGTEMTCHYVMQTKFVDVSGRFGMHLIPEVEACDQPSTN